MPGLPFQYELAPQALRGCPLPEKCVRHAVPHFILTTLKSVFLRLFTGEETEAERGDTPGGQRLGGVVAEFQRTNLLLSLDSLPPQPFVGGVLTHPFPLPQLAGPCLKAAGASEPERTGFTL